jgi:hypothetical protein
MARRQIVPANGTGPWYAVACAVGTHTDAHSVRAPWQGLDATNPGRALGLLSCGRDCRTPP